MQLPAAIAAPASVFLWSLYSGIKALRGLVDVDECGQPKLYLEGVGSSPQARKGTRQTSESGRSNLQQKKEQLYFSKLWQPCGLAGCRII